MSITNSQSAPIGSPDAESLCGTLLLGLRGSRLCVKHKKMTGVNPLPAGRGPCIILEGDLIEEGMMYQVPLLTMKYEGI
jgi:hypothetical protein